MMMKTREIINTTLNGGGDSWWSINAHTVIFIVVAINIGNVVCEPLNIYSNFQYLLAILSHISALLFCIEYILRIWVAPLSHPPQSSRSARIKYIISFYGIVDFISIIPFIAPILLPEGGEISALINVSRIFLILKVIRYSKAFALLRHVVREVKYELMVTLSLSVSIIIFAALMMYYIERGAQPDLFYNTGQGLWWAIITFTTVGYGDIYPITPLGKILAGAIAVISIGLIALPTAILSSSLINVMSRRKKQGESDLKQDDNYCSHCGKPIDKEE